MYNIASYVQAKDVPDAIRALSADENAILICGGSDVLIKIREGKFDGCSLVSIHGMPSLVGVSLENDKAIKILPATTFTEITAHPLVQKHIPAVGEAVDQAGGPQLRNIATVGGNICNGATSADSPPTLLCLNAELEITGPQGVRRQPLETFYKGPGKVNLEHGELLTAIRVAQKDYEGFGGHYIKYAQRNAMDIATLGCAVFARLGKDKKTVEEARLAFGVAAPTPIRCHQAEAAVAGMEIGEEMFAKIGEVALTEVKPRTSWRASEAFRRQLVRELSGRALRQAILNAGGELPA